MDEKLNITNDPGSWPNFEDIPEPRMVCFGTGNGSGSKLLQSFIDGHPQIYMIPGYQLLYFYPHWHQWKEELKQDWHWGNIIDRFCEKHASVIDSRRIPANDGLANLGEKRDQWLEIDENLFKGFLKHLLKNQPLRSRTFLLAVHYAYAFCRNEDLADKKCLVYHIHVHEYGPRFLEKDFPDMLAIAMVRDPRSNINGRYRSTVKLDAQKLDYTDAVVYLRRTYYFIWEYLLESMSCLKNLPPENVRVVRHEDMHYALKELMQRIAAFVGVKFDEVLLKSTFGGLLWWGSKIYNMAPMNKPNPRVVSLDWQERMSPLDWFVIEGLFYDYIVAYDYQLYKYKIHAVFKRLALFILIFLPSSYEIEVLVTYLKPKTMIEFVRHSYSEAYGRIDLKDYSFNAYYRHKWYNKGLYLWKDVWYKSMVHNSLARLQNSSSVFEKLLHHGVCHVYAVTNLIRYFLSFFLFPYWIFKKSILSIKTFVRLVLHKNCLPENMMNERIKG
ncbi:MAG: sulfotransferase [Desulfobacteraceae bacterium]|nr:sulfotransferase [Desulfobacteraceae bacterium]